MHGLIFVTWEKFLAERFGHSLLYAYRSAIGETATTTPLAGRVYNDEALIAGVQAACKLTGFAANSLLHEYGHYFMANGLTGYLCAYLLTRVHSGRDLLLAMRDAHAQMRRTPDGLTPPLFHYEAHSANPNNFTLIYDSPRQLCPVLLGAIEGAAARYGEQVSIVEQSCMKRGAPTCRMDIYFQNAPKEQRSPAEIAQIQQRRRAKQQLADMVLVILPDQNGYTLLDIQQRLQGTTTGPLRPSVLLEVLQHLQYAGLLASTANQPGDYLTRRRYWRAPRSE